jgi:hypothetical protein
MTRDKAIIMAQNMERVSSLTVESSGLKEEEEALNYEDGSCRRGLNVS